MVRFIAANQQKIDFDTEKWKFRSDILFPFCVISFPKLVDTPPELLFIDSIKQSAENAVGKAAKSDEKFVEEKGFSFYSSLTQVEVWIEIEFQFCRLCENLRRSLWMCAWGQQNKKHSQLINYFQTRNFHFQLNDVGK